MPKRRARTANEPGRPDPAHNFRPVLRDLARSRASLVSVFADFCRVTACSLALQTREDEYLRAIKPYTPTELTDGFARAAGLLIQEMNDTPFTDVLGPFYTAAIATADQAARGEFYTPQSVAHMMARMTLDPEAIKAAGAPVTLCDPCAGSGGLILACAQALAPNHVDLLRVTAQDLNPVACDMAYINTTLWGVPAEVILSNSLTNETVSRWANPHWHRVGEEQRRRGLHTLHALRERIEAPSTEHAASKPQDTPPPAPPAPPTGPHEQLGLF